MKTNLMKKQIINKNNINLFLAKNKIFKKYKMLIYKSVSTKIN